MTGDTPDFTAARDHVLQTVVQFARRPQAEGTTVPANAALTTLRRRWPTAVDRRTVTLMVSDGLEVGEVDELETTLARVARRSRALVWFNPLAASGSWEPTCRGMAAAEPYLDGLFAFGGPADLADAARQLSRWGPRGPVGYEHDFRDRSGGASS
jgi:uncharacterized protein with von Willebrand factor type A (vWA) domain